MPTKQKPRRRVWPFLVLTALGVVVMCGVEAGYIAWLVGPPAKSNSGTVVAGWGQRSAKGLAWELVYVVDFGQLDQGYGVLEPLAEPRRMSDESPDPAGRSQRLEQGPHPVALPSWSVFSEPPAASLAQGTRLLERAYGWPVRLYVWRQFRKANGADIEAPIPTSPLAWKNATGFLAASTVLSAAGSFGLVRLGGWLRRRRARLRNACEHCGYSLAGLDRASSTATCPECGEPSASGTVPGR